MNQQLEDFYLHLNDSVVTTNDFEEGTEFRKREKVTKFAYCGLNPMYRHYLSFDLDDAQSAFRYEVVNLPPPTIITINPINGHCHYLYKLKTPVAYHANSRDKPQQFFEAIQSHMSQLLNADIAFTHTLTKNPLHDRWKIITHPTSYHLSDFLEYFDLPKHDNLVIKQKHRNAPGNGRNCDLFNTLRFWAYEAVKNYTSEESWHQDMQARARGINLSFRCPLPLKEVRDTAATTARFTWKHRHTLNFRKRVLEFTKETPHERMSKGAEYTNALRSSKALISLQTAFNNLTLAEVDPTPINLMHKSGLNIKTVRKYLDSVIRG